MRHTFAIARVVYRLPRRERRSRGPQMITVRYCRIRVLRSGGRAHGRQPAASPAAPLVQAQSGAKPAAPKAAAAPPQQLVDGGWPRAYTTPSGAALIVYQPQVASWDDQKHMAAYAAVSYTPKGATKPALGTLKLEADTKVAVDERLVSFSAAADHRVQLPDAAEGAGAGRSSPRSPRRSRDEERVIALDRVLANLDKSQIIPKNVEGVKADPPPIFFSTDAGGPRQPRRRADLEPDQGQRSEVRGQHELGSLPARADQDVLPAQRRTRG